jgi:triacylglycerol lipase
MGRTRSRIALVAVLLASAVGLLTGGRGAAASTAYPVPYDFAVSVVFGGLKPYADPPGANDWTCRPSAAHPEPVVLVHGTGGNKSTNWQTYAPLLANNGYCVFALTYGVQRGTPFPFDQLGGADRIENSAAELGAFVDKVLAATHARKVDIVGHSQGTLMPNYYVKFLGGAAKIDKYVSLASLWNGTSAGGTSWERYSTQAFGFAPTDLFAPALAEMGTGSAFMIKMRAGGVAVPGVHYTNIVTKYDELVQPYTSGTAPGMTNIVLQNQCALDHSDHLEIAADPIAAVDVLNALDPAHPRPVPCRLVLPVIG